LDPQFQRTHSFSAQFRYTRRPNPFGLDLLLLAPGTAREAIGSLADDIWAR